MAQKDKPVKDVSATEMLHNIESATGLHLRFDSLAQRIVVDLGSGKHRIFNDGDLTSVYNFCRENAPILEHKAYKNLHAIDCAIASVRVTRSFNPLKEYLNNCLYKYKEQPADYFSEMISHLELGDDTEVQFLYRWLHGVLGRVQYNHQNDMLIMKGKQGIGKSSFFIELMKNIKDFYMDEDVNLYDKDQVLYLGTKLIWVLEEFGTVLKSSDRNKVKAFLTKEQIEKRQAYAKFASKFERVCSHAGTTNDEEFLTDLTGNRRYLIVRLLKIDLEWFQEHFNPDLLWGQVFANLCEHGVKICKLTADEQAAKDEGNESNMISDPLADMMASWFEVDPDGVVYSTEIEDKIRVSGKSNVSWYKVADILATLGARRGRIGHKQKRGYLGIAWKPSEVPAAQDDNIRFFKPR